MSSIEIRELWEAATALYDAGHWSCDHSINENALWMRLRRALGHTSGNASKPVKQKDLITEQWERVRKAFESVSNGITILEYQQMVTDTTLPKARNLEYVLLNLCSEAGEAGQKYAKYLRDGGTLNVDGLIAELGDVLWCVTCTAQLLGYTLTDVMANNNAKLRSRQSRGTLQGSGDVR